MAYYQLHTHKSVEALKKKQRAKVREESSESESEIMSISDIMHDVVTSSEDDKLTDKESTRKEIAIEIEEEKPGAGQQDVLAPHQLTIKVHRMNEPKKVTELSSPVNGTVSAVIEHHRETTVPSIEISAHNKHGHVRQH